MNSVIEDCEQPIKEIMGLCGAASVSIGVVHEGNSIYKASFGLRDIENELPANSSTLYCIASLSKSFLSAAVGILVSRGVLDWREPLKMYLPDFDPVGDPNIARHANLIDVLCHATGLAQHDVLHIGPRGTNIADRRDLVRILNGLPTANEHGARFRRYWLYNNDVTALAAEIIEKKSTKHYGEFLRENIFEPLGMRRTFASGRQEDENSAHPYARLSDGTMTRLHPTSFLAETATASIHCGLRSSVEDMLIWGQSILARWKWEDAKSEDKSNMDDPPNDLQEISTILSDFYPQPANDRHQNLCAYCLGWLKVVLPSSNVGLLSFNKETKLSGADHRLILGEHSPPLQVIMHNGKVTGYNSIVMMFPETDSVIVVLSSGGTDGDPSDWIGRILTQALFDLKPRVDFVVAAKDEAELSRQWFKTRILAPLEKDRTEQTGKVDFPDYIGTYTNAELATTIYIEYTQDAPAVRFNDQISSSYPLAHHCGDTYSFLPKTRDEWLKDCMLEYFDHRMGLLRFRRESDGVISGVLWQWHYREEASWFARQPS
ncbi:putative penicillin-binding protein [Trematosphaeria pertusa]|uniref:Putative penicillin-binding protein n=1 Tax=Trematosphaeria pertusa TaxID=390896 RepID=A0A6A6IRM8_9PLEO|nr:putative penicillin-binding protein [Trematosphaeria pertusa]KAF2252797.1 putative penicillin-binding protein [Trematosphaeria pertusa]